VDSSFDFAIDFAAYQQHETTQVEPGEQDDHRAQRTVGRRVVIEVMKRTSGGKGSYQPTHHAQSGAGR